MVAVELKEWNPKNAEYFSHGSINGIGLAQYWIAVHQALETWDKQQMKEKFLEMHKVRITPTFAGSQPRKERNFNNTPFTSNPAWHQQSGKDSYYRFHWKDSDTRFKLP